MKVHGLLKRPRRGPVHSPGLAMLEGVADLTLAQLNEATQAWIEMEYNRSVHSALGEAPLQRYLHHRDVGRPCPSSAELKMAFTAQTSRTQRRSDGTFSLKGIRFEIPSRYHHFQRLSVRAAFWDLSLVHLADPKKPASSSVGSFPWISAKTLKERVPLKALHRISQRRPCRRRPPTWRRSCKS
jgi:hypothetical protein